MTSSTLRHLCNFTLCALHGDFGRKLPLRAHLCHFYIFAAIEPVIADDPCDPNPCGPYSNPPRNVGDRCDCSCLPGMIGSPPNCRPECIRNSDCPTDKACRNQKCIDPCPGLCGRNAHCDVRNHIPICVCDQGFIGDPFSSCYRPTSKF